MTPEEYLKQINKLEHIIQCDQERAKEYERRSYSIPGPSYGEKIGSNPNRNLEAPFTKWLYKQMEIEEKIKSEIEFLDKLKVEATTQIELLEDVEERNVLVYRYFSNMTWGDIVEKMHYSQRTILRKHKSALENFKVPEDSILSHRKLTAHDS